MSFLDHLYLNGNINFKEYPDYTTQKDINNLTKDIQYCIGKLEYNEDKGGIDGVSDLESEVSNIDDIRSGEDAVWSLEQVVDEFESFYNKVEKYFVNKEDFDALEELEIWDYKRPTSFDIEKNLADRLSEYSTYWRISTDVGSPYLISKTQPFVSVSLYRPSYQYGKYGSTWIASTPKLKKFFTDPLHPTPEECTLFELETGKTNPFGEF